MTEKNIIMNRNGKKISIEIYLPENPKDSVGLAFIAHGLGGTKEYADIVSAANAFTNAAIIAVTYDARDSFGESEGNYENATTTGYYNDLEDVITWTKNQPLENENIKNNIYIFGTSTGGLCAITYAQRHPDLSGLILHAPDTDYINSIRKYTPELVEEWRKTGWKIKNSKSVPGQIKKLNWKNYEDDLKRYDAFKSIIDVPTLLIEGEKDNYRLDDEKEQILSLVNKYSDYLFVKGMPHVPSEKNHLEEIQEKIKEFIKKIEGMNKNENT